MEAIFLVCGAGGPQLKRNPLGSTTGEHLTNAKLGALIAGILVGLASAGFGCQNVQARSPIYQSGQGGRTVPIRVLFASPNGGIRRPLREVVDNQEAFERLWDESHGAAIPRPTLPKVDFEREVVLVASMGWQAAVGSQIAITAARDHDNILEVTVELRPFPVGCDAFPSVTYPVVIASMPSSRSTVVFKDRIIQEKC